MFFCSINVVSSAFEGQSAVNRQRMVYKAIWEELQNVVHAVDQMTTKTPSEVWSLEFLNDTKPNLLFEQRAKLFCFIKTNLDVCFCCWWWCVIRLCDILCCVSFLFVVCHSHKYIYVASWTWIITVVYKFHNMLGVIWKKFFAHH